MFFPLCIDFETYIFYRCLFEVERFVSENDLQFLGATWYVATSDAYVAYLKVQRGEPEEEVCKLIPGYDDPCPSSGGISHHIMTKWSRTVVDIVIGVLIVFVTVSWNI